MKGNVVKDKSFEFAVKIVAVYNLLKDKKHEYVLSKQLLRSGTAIGALIRESEHAESKADFINKLSIALKEANETNYWLELLLKTNYLENDTFKSIINDSTELIKLLTSIIISSKKNKV